MKWHFYIYPAIPLLALVIPYFVAKFNQSKIVLVALFLCLIMYSYRAFSPNRIDFLHTWRTQSIIFRQKPEIPVIIRVHCVGLLCSFISFVQDTQLYEFPHSDEMLMKKINNYKEVFVLIEKNESNDFVFPENYSIMEQYSSYFDFFTVYHLQKSD
jgi:hypothetical protein